MPAHCLRLPLLLAALAIVMPAAAWQATVPFRAKVHDHVFDKVDLSNDECTLKAKVYFSAPDHAYRSEAKVRNHYRFKARVRLKNGQAFTSGVFFSRGPARRSYVFEHDTSAAGCWARGTQQVTAVDVDGCRGEGCKVQAFKD